jgi:hypothetical protein
MDTARLPVTMIYCMAAIFAATRGAKNSDKQEE